MKHEERMSVIEDALLRFQARYTPPRAMSKDAQIETFTATSASINRKLPAKVTPDGIRDRLGRIFEYVADRHDTNAWPLQSEYTKAVNATATTARDVADTEWKVDPIAAAARKIRAGDPVGHEWLFGRNFYEMSSQEGITTSDIQPYRDALFYADRDMVGEDEAKRRQGDRMARNISEPYWLKPGEDHGGNRSTRINPRGFK